jgi:hypothetical protein
MVSGCLVAVAANAKQIQWATVRPLVSQPAMPALGQIAKKRSCELVEGCTKGKRRPTSCSWMVRIGSPQFLGERTYCYAASRIVKARASFTWSWFK